MPVLSDSALPIAANNEYGVYAFVLGFLVDSQAVWRPVGQDTFFVLDHTQAAVGVLRDAQAPAGFEGAMAAYQSSNASSVALVGGFGIQRPVVFLSLSAVWHGPRDRQVYAFSRAGFNVDSTRAVVFVNGLQPEPHGSGGRLLSLARKPGRAWTLWSLNIEAE